MNTAPGGPAEIMPFARIRVIRGSSAWCIYRTEGPHSPGSEFCPRVAGVENAAERTKLDFSASCVDGRAGNA